MERNKKLSTLTVYKREDMALKIKPPLQETFVLERADENYGNGGEPTIVVIRQATQKQYETRSNLYSTTVSELGEGNSSVKVTQRFSAAELHRVEAYLTLAGSNIKTEDENGVEKSLFNFGKNGLQMSEDSFKEAWGRLPIDVAEEIHEKVIALNPTWGPQGEAS